MDTSSVFRGVDGVDGSPRTADDDETDALALAAAASVRRFFATLGPGRSGGAGLVTVKTFGGFGTLKMVGTAEWISRAHELRRLEVFGAQQVVSVELLW